MNWAAFGAFGAWFSGAATFLAVLVALSQNKRKLKLSVTVENKDRYPSVVFKMTNVGNRLVTVSRWGIKSKKEMGNTFDLLLHQPPPNYINDIKDKFSCEVKVNATVRLPVYLGIAKDIVDAYKNENEFMGEKKIVFYVEDELGKRYSCKSKYTMKCFLDL